MKTVYLEDVSTTTFAPGGNWNDKPPGTHQRRFLEVIVEAPTAVRAMVLAVIAGLQRVFTAIRADEIAVGIRAGAAGNRI